MEQLDVLIAGAGPSGLLLASELAPHARVAVVERQAIVQSRKYWLTNLASLRENPHLAVATDTTYSSLRFIANDGTTASVPGTYVLWNTAGLLTSVSSSLRPTDTPIHFNAPLYAVRKEKRGLAVQAGRFTLHTRLLVDCMGYQSPIATTRGAVRILGHYLLYGYSLRLRSPLDPVGLHNVAMNRRPVYLEVLPTNSGSAHTIVIMPVRQYSQPSQLNSELSFVLEHTPYGDYLEKPGQDDPPLSGIVPVGHLRRPALDRVLFYGEAGQANPATSATTMTRILLSYRGLARHIRSCIEEDTLTARHLSDYPADLILTRFNRAFQERLFEDLVSFTSDDFTKLVQCMSHTDPRLVYELVFGDARPTPRTIAQSALRPETRFLGKYLLASGLRTVGRTLTGSP